MDRKSQILMSVLGVFALVIVTVGVSYAFFTYTRTGTHTNSIQSGKISFYFTETSNGINLTNAMPVSDTTALAVNSQADNSNVGYFTFDVGTVDLSGIEIDYSVYLDKVTLTNGEKALNDSYVSLQMDAGSTVKSNALANPVVASTLFNGTNTAKIATATVTTANERHTYNLRMWLSDSNSNLNIAASDTNGNGIIVSGDNYTVSDDNSTVSSNWGGATFSVKVRVATDGVRTAK